MEERLQKYMARCGVDSRRKCEELIAQGLVELNGEIVREPGIKIDPARDRIKVNGKLLRIEQPAHYVHYKVKGVTTTVADDLGRKTVMDCLPDIRERVYPVGRLDKESEGLIILTNDGELANYLTHPAHGVEKTYRVVAEGRIDEEVLRTLADKGMRLGPVLVRPSRVELVRYDNENTIVLISVSEGINREVRRIFAALGHEVKKLLRTQVGPVSLVGMKRGATRPLLPKELSQIRKGMAGASPEAEQELFPAGTAKRRKPTGPRGRPRRTKAPRQGKPDPAAAQPKADKSRGKVVVDEWKKTVTSGRHPRPAAAAAPRQGKPAIAGDRPRPGKGRDRATADEWKKTAAPGRRSRTAADTAPRQGKPAAAGDRPRPGKGRDRATADEWKKTAAPGRRSRMAADTAPRQGKPAAVGDRPRPGKGRDRATADEWKKPAASKPLRPLRPTKPAAKPASKSTMKKSGGPAGKASRPARGISHPLASRPAGRQDGKHGK